MAFRRKRSRSSRRFSMKRRRSGKSRVSSTRRIVSQVLNRKTETKFFDLAVQNEQLYHNLGWGTSILPPTICSSISNWFNPWLNIQQGTGRFNRIGDTITPRGMMIKMFLANKQDRPNTQYRVIVARLPKVYNGSITTLSFDPFQSANAGSCGNLQLLPADLDKGVKFYYDKIHKMPGANIAFGAGYNGAKEFTKTIKLWIKRKRAGNIKFDTNGNTLVNAPVAIYVLPYEQYDTLTTSNIASMTGFMRMYYKDI